MEVHLKPKLAYLFVGRKYLSHFMVSKGKRRTSTYRYPKNKNLNLNFEHHLINIAQNLGDLWHFSHKCSIH